MQRRRVAGRLALGLFTALGLCGGAAAQSPGSRRDELARVQEALADPDPLARLAALEGAVRSGDSLKTQLALRTAFAGDDPDLRALAMRGYLAGKPTITFDIVLPAETQKSLEAARGDTLAMRSVVTNNRYLPWIERIGFKFGIEITEYELPRDKGNLAGTHRLSAFAVSGDRVSTLTNIGGTSCFVDFAPTRRMTLEGSMACPGWPKLAVTARMS